MLEGEHAFGDNVGYDTLYVGGGAGGTLDFGTGVVTSQAIDVSELSAAQLVNADIEGTDPRNAFAVGDIIHATDDIIVGEIESMADANTITFKADGSATTSQKGDYTVPERRDCGACSDAGPDVGDAARNARRVRPTALQPLWHLAGFALGAGTALMGERAAMACTVAVEEAIDEHYAKQAKYLGEDESELRDLIVAAREDEIEHRNTALEAGAERAPLFEPMRHAIKSGTKLAIWLSERV